MRVVDAEDFDMDTLPFWFIALAAAVAMAANLKTLFKLETATEAFIMVAVFAAGGAAGVDALNYIARIGQHTGNSQQSQAAVHPTLRKTDHRRPNERADEAVAKPGGE